MTEEQKARYDALDLESAVLGLMPKSAKSFRAQLLEHLRAKIALLQKMIRSDGFGYYFDNEVIEDVERALADAARTSELGSIILDRRLRKAFISNLKAKTAESDISFREFACQLPMATMNARAPTFEPFTIKRSDGRELFVRCENGHCKAQD